MVGMTNELKAKLLAAKDIGEVTALLKAEGREITQEESAKLWEEIEKRRGKDGRELSLDELESVSGGYDRDYLTDGCSATVEPGSWCWSDDLCYEVDVTYFNRPLRHCEKCGGISYHTNGQWSKCINCGHEEWWT